MQPIATILRWLITIINLKNKKMANIEITDQGGGGSTPLATGILQIANGLPLDATLRNVADQNNTNSPLKLSTSLVQTTSTLRITTQDNPYIDAEDGGGNNRFTIGRDPLSQQVNVDFASNPTGSTTIVGGIRTYKDGVNLATTMVFREDGHIGIGETTNPSGLLHVDGGANVPRIILDADTNVARIFSFRTNDTQRWAFRIDGNETGTNAGSDFAIRRYNDAGTFVDAPLNITRSSGNIGVNTTTTTAAKLTLKGTGSTSATTSLQVQNSAGNASLQITDDGSVFNYGKNGITTNTAFGVSSLISITTGTGNTSFGYQAGRLMTTPTRNTAFGSQALSLTTTGGDNSAFGNQALYNNTTGRRNDAFGVSALANNTIGESNAAFGRAALNINIDGSYNIAIGGGSLSTNTSGGGNTSVGFDSLNDNSTGNGNTSVGYNTKSGNFNGSLILGSGATATANNQAVFGSATTNAGAVTSEVNTSTQVWNVIINGVARKILLA